MSTFWKSFFGAFFGKIVAVLFTAVCLLLGFGPDKWAKSMIENLPLWITPTIARYSFLFLGFVTLFTIIYPYLKKKFYPASGKVTQLPEDNLKASPRISLVDLCKYAVEHGWKFVPDGSHHVFDFVGTLRDAGSTEGVQFWGRKKQRIDSQTIDQALIKIPSDYWAEFRIGVMSLLKISPSNGETIGLQTDNFQTVTANDAGMPQQQLYVDIHADRENSINWILTEGVKRRGESLLEDHKLFDDLNDETWSSE